MRQSRPSPLARARSQFMGPKWPDTQPPVPRAGRRMRPGRLPEVPQGSWSSSGTVWHLAPPWRGGKVGERRGGSTKPLMKALRNLPRPPPTFHGLRPTFHGIQPTFHGLQPTFHCASRISATSPYRCSVQAALPSAKCRAHHPPPSTLHPTASGLVHAEDGGARTPPCGARCTSAPQAQRVI